MCAAGALIEMPAERSRTTPRNSQQHFDMLPTDPLAVSLDEGSSSSADEIGNLERRRGHWSTPPTTGPPLISKTLCKHSSAPSFVTSAPRRLPPNAPSREGKALYGLFPVRSIKKEN